MPLMPIFSEEWGSFPTAVEQNIDGVVVGHEGGEGRRSFGIVDGQVGRRIPERTATCRTAGLPRLKLLPEGVIEHVDTGGHWVFFFNGLLNWPRMRSVVAVGWVNDLHHGGSSLCVGGGGGAEGSERRRSRAWP